MDADLSSLPDDLDALKAALIAARTEAAAEKACAVAAVAELARGRALIAHLNLEIEKLRRAIYGPRSERTARLLDQLELQLEEAEADAAEDELAAEHTKPSTTVRSFARKRPARKPFPDHLPRERVVIPAPKSCPCCGSAKLSKLGEDITETLEVVPRQWKVIQTVRERFSCRECETITQPPAPFHVTPRGFAGPNLLAMILFEKFGQHQPLNRQSERYAREGVDLSLSTLADQVGACAAALRPLHRDCQEFRVRVGHNGNKGAPMPRRKEPLIPDAILDQLLAGADAKTAFDPNGLLDELKKALAERVLNAEMDHHLAGEERGNRRNGYGKKTVITDTGQIELEVPRDRQASFDPQLIAKYQRRFPGFDDKIISMYARGMSTREIVGHLRELYGIEVSPDLISAVTDAVLEEVAAWQARPLEATYPLVFFDALRVKIRDEGLVRNKAVHIALGVRADGAKEILGLWLEQNEGAKFWLRVMNELKNRGVEDMLVAVVDGLKGFPDAITAAFPTGDGADLHRPSAAPQPGFRLLEGPQARGGGAQGLSTGPSMPPAAKPRSRPSRRAPGAANTRRSARAGGGPGERSSRSMPSRAMCGGFSTRRMPSRR